MKYAFIALLLTALAFGQDTAPAGPNDPSSTPQTIPTDKANSQKAKDVLDQAIQALGGQVYLSVTDMKSEGRGYSFHHGQPNSLGTVFWRSRKFPDKDRVELTKKRDIIQIYNGDKGYEITYKGVRALDQKDELDPYLRRRHYSLDVVLRQWLNQPGVALFYEGQTVATQKQAEQVTIMNNKSMRRSLCTSTSLLTCQLRRVFPGVTLPIKSWNVEEEIFDNYLPIQNIMTPFDTTRLFIGEMSAQTFLTSASYNQGLTDSLFDPQIAKFIQAALNLRFG